MRSGNYRQGLQETFLPYQKLGSAQRAEKKVPSILVRVGNANPTDCHSGITSGRNSNRWPLFVGAKFLQTDGSLAIRRCAVFAVERLDHSLHNGFIRLSKQQLDGSQ